MQVRPRKLSLTNIDDCVLFSLSIGAEFWENIFENFWNISLLINPAVVADFMFTLTFCSHHEFTTLHYVFMFT